MLTTAFSPSVIRPAGRPIFRIYLQGTDHEIGLERGRILAPDLWKMWEWMDVRFGSLYGLPDECRVNVADILEKSLSKNFPWMAEQLHGMAAASGLPFSSLVLINHYGLIWNNQGNWCTSIALNDAVEGPLLGQNLDIGSEDFYYVERQRATSAHTILSDAMLGMCWSPCGMNDKGLMVGSSNLPAPGCPAHAWTGEGVTYHFLPRLVLRNCGSVHEALDFLRSLPETIPANNGYQLNLIDEKGMMAVVDKIGTRTVIRQVKEGPNFTSNCTQDEEFEAWRLGSTGDNRDGRERADRILREWNGRPDNQPASDWMASLLRNDSGRGALCRTNEHGYSRLSFICHGRSKCMEISNGPPNRIPYERINFYSE